jgi:hypothetical protein
VKTPKGFPSCNAVPLDEVLSILAKSTRVESRLRTTFGLKESELALEMLRQAKLAGDLGASVHDFLSDEIANEAEEVLTLYARGSFGAYPVSVMGYEGAFFVQAPEFDDFISK